MRTPESILRLNFTDLQCWQKATKLAKEINSMLYALPDKPMLASVADQLSRASISVPSNIAEAHGKGTPKMCAAGLNHAIGSLQEVITQISIVSVLHDCPDSDRWMRESTELLAQLRSFRSFMRGEPYLEAA